MCTPPSFLHFELHTDDRFAVHVYTYSTDLYACYSEHAPACAYAYTAAYTALSLHNTLVHQGMSVGDMPKSPSSQYGLKGQEDIDPRGISVTNGPMR